MGLTEPTAQFLRHLQRTGVCFRETLTIGHQSIHMSSDEYARHLDAVGAKAGTPDGYADDFFRALGAQTLEIADCSSYEGATLCQDLNVPVPAATRRQFDCVFDGGALEHVFNFPQALKSCMEFTRVGGHLVIAAPGNNFFGHGFYQLSPELFFQALVPANGFEIEALLLCESGRWYEVAAPAIVGSRVELLTRDPLLLFVVARRVANVEPFRVWPQQSDYLTVWNTGSDSANGLVAPSRWKNIALRFAPVRRLQQRWRDWKRKRVQSLSNRTFFKPVTLQV